MKILLVEDNDSFIEELLITIEEVDRNIEILVAKSRDSAIPLIADAFFDLIILDLSIPTVDGALDAKADYGFEIFGMARKLAPGTPIMLLTASPAEDFIPDILKEVEQIDIWGVGSKVGNVSFLKKHRFTDFTELFNSYYTAVNSLFDIELTRHGVDFSVEEDRLIRIFSQETGGKRCEVSPVGGGLSGAKVVRLRVIAENGAPLYDSIAKIGSIKDVESEEKKYDEFVSRLEPAATPRKVSTLKYGAKDFAGVFFGLANGYTISAFGLADSCDGSARQMIMDAQDKTNIWLRDVPETRKSIGELRQVIVSDDVFQSIVREHGIDWAAEFEDLQVQMRWCIMHGDLHGDNLLVNNDKNVVLIDYADINYGAASFDPITLELSLLFHPNSLLYSSDWPTEEQAMEWGHLESYTVNCPAAEFVTACREWAENAGVGNREIAASAYCYLVRQLKYDGSNKTRVLALLKGVRSFFVES